MNSLSKRGALAAAAVMLLALTGCQSSTTDAQEALPTAEPVVTSSPTPECSLSDAAVQNKVKVLVNFWDEFIDIDSSEYNSRVQEFAISQFALLMATAAQQLNAADCSIAADVRDLNNGPVDDLGTFIDASTVSDVREGLAELAANTGANAPKRS